VGDDNPRIAGVIRAGKKSMERGRRGCEEWQTRNRRRPGWEMMRRPLSRLRSWGYDDACSTVIRMWGWRLKTLEILSKERVV